MPEISVPSIVLSETFNNKEEKPPYNISIRLDESGISFLLSDTLQNKLLQFIKYDYTACRKAGGPSLKDFCSRIVESSDIIRKADKLKDFICGLNDFVLIPSSHYVEGRDDGYFVSEKEAVNLYHYFSEILPDKSTRIIFRGSKDIYEVTGLVENKTQVKHSIACLYEAHAKAGFQTLGSASIRVSGNTFDFIAFAGGKLQLANTFVFDSNTDFLYFLLLAFKNSGLNPEESDLYLSGEIDPDSILVDGVHKYIRNYSFYKAVENLQTDDFPDIHSHFFIGHYL